MSERSERVSVTVRFAHGRTIESVFVKDCRESMVRR